MARSFILLFCGALFVLCQIVVSNAAGACQERSPAVKLCNDDSGSAHTVFVDTSYVPTFDNRTCTCTLDIGNGNPNVDMKVTRKRAYTSDISIFINNNKVLVSSDLKTFRYTPGMTIKFEMTDAKFKVQCFKFEIVSPATRNVSITCKRAVLPDTEAPKTTTTVVPEKTTTVVPETTNVVPETTTTVAQVTSASRDTNWTQRTEPRRNTNTVTAETTSPGAKESGTSQNTNGIDIGVVAGAAGGGLAVVVVVVIISVVLCKRRGASEKARKHDASDLHNEEPEYSLTTNAGYVSADDCLREADRATEHDPRGYTLVNKPKPKQQHTQQTAVDDDNYNHLNDVLHTHTPANVYNTRAEATAESDIDDYNRLNEYRKPNETDNVYNVASSTTNAYNEYDRTNVPTRNVPAENEYSTPNKVYKP